MKAERLEKLNLNFNFGGQNCYTEKLEFNGSTCIILFRL